MVQIGKIFAERYRVLREIGRGGMANVYLAEDIYLDKRPVAVKILRPNFENDAVAIARFQREAYAMAELSHPNIVAIYDVGEFEGQQYIVMEYVDGLTLKKYIVQKAPLSNEDAVEKISAILAAIQLAHTRGIIHRDLKPQNILIATNGEVKVTDFGIAKALGETSLTQTNSMFGSVHYLSPEQARGTNATVQSDIYAIGIVLYEMLVGRVPFDGDSAVTIALKHFQESLPSIIAANPQVPQALENVVIRATAKSLKNRYQTALDMENDVASSLSLDRQHEPKLIFPKATNTGNPNLKNIALSGNTDELVRQVSNEVAQSEPRSEEDLASQSTQQYKTKNLIPANQVQPAPFVKSAQQPTKKKRGKRPLFFAIFAVFGLLLGGGGVYALLSTSSSAIYQQIPDVQGLPQSSATSTLEKAGFKVDPQVSYETNSSVTANNVVKTSPPVGSKEKEGSSVTLVLSKGSAQVTMPNYKNTDGTYSTTVQALESQLVNNLGVSKSIISVVYKDTANANADQIVYDSNPGIGDKFDPTKGTVILTAYQYKASVVSSSFSSSEPSSSYQEQSSVQPAPPASSSVPAASGPPSSSATTTQPSSSGSTSNSIDLNVPAQDQVG